MSHNLPEIQGIGHDGKPATFTFAEGRLYHNECPDCGETNGGGIVNEKHPEEWHRSDPYGPCKTPCIRCGKGPMVMVYDD